MTRQVGHERFQHIRIQANCFHDRKTIVINTIAIDIFIDEALGGF